MIQNMTVLLKLFKIYVYSTLVVSILWGVAAYSSVVNDEYAFCMRMALAHLAYGSCMGLIQDHVIDPKPRSKVK